MLGQDELFAAQFGDGLDAMSSIKSSQAAGPGLN